ncbi:hypothetical protein QN372_03440 [Undibacterium sp. RTI2.1]|uniref:hypothetical protein n=1 Tax=unclassified Undibacterium TaxID=2630295 RepID=UPI002AB33C69|nr:MULTISPECIES: hypothetical protein [unclassified Undibacterium]MDY7540546.1 hypothetical protein [Undibacterium sp. 5I1]MEB0029791.1 hypothetical protein [Undibacterium sp. RTI2.1]MEB0118101.1 hypothetical protein [Undibacterium sp. RTI2.2]MEB0231208.1 hypothetical protein [Undibacterium sp. 10I3]MEB0256511.1 hypothetical protein [Undibacterium sp. 5I1]
MFKLLVITSALVLTGCASVSGEKLQPVSVITVQDNKEVAGIGCTLKNDAGSWFVTSPASVVVHKSTGDLAIDCKKDDLAGNTALVSKSNGAVWGNILLGGGIGYIVDRNTGAGFDYPSSVTIILRKIGEVVGVQTPAATTAPVAPTASASQTPAQATTATVTK